MGCVLPACRHWTSLLYWLTPCWLRRYIYTHKPWEFLIPDSSPCATPCLLISYQVYGPRHTKCLPLSFSLSHVLMLTNEHHWWESSVQASPIAPPFGRCCHVQAGISLWMSNIAKGVSPSMGYRGKKASVPLPIDFFFFATERLLFSLHCNEGLIVHLSASLPFFHSALQLACPRKPACFEHTLNISQRL